MLKAVRKAIAEANNIPYQITECNSSVHCDGTCRVCDNEVQSFNQQLSQLAAIGKAVVIPSSDTSVFDEYLPAKPLVVSWDEW